MSEAERKQRLAYKQNRKKWMIIQIVAIALVAVILMGSLITYAQLNKTYYIPYTERGDVDYDVALKPNDFYEEAVLDKGQLYVASLIDRITADFSYELDMGANNVNYEYTYGLEAQLIIADKAGTPIFSPVYELKAPGGKQQSSNNTLTINERVELDYEQYNALAQEFVSTYDLKNVVSTLAVRMNVTVVGACAEFKEDSRNTYTLTLNIPLTEKTVNVQMLASAPDGESKILACGSSINKNVFAVMAIVAGVLDVLLIAALLAFTYLTRNEDIDYTNKIRKILSNYGSYIQQLEEEFDTEGYQILRIKTFEQMLSIRDTLQSPILMYENEDRTMSRFVILTNTKALHLFDIKVDNYDLIYGIEEEQEEAAAVEEPVEEEDVFEIEIELAENADAPEEELAEAMAAPNVDLTEIEYVDEIDETYDGAEGVEVIGVVWPEHEHKNKIYRYDPNGYTLDDGDIVLVPTRDAARDKVIIRKAAVAHGNHFVDPQNLKHPLKKILGVVRHKAIHMLSSDSES